MSVAFVAQAAANVVNLSSIPITVPVNATPGDLAVVVVGVSSDTPLSFVNPPTDAFWVRVDELHDSASVPGLTASAFYKILESGEPGQTINFHVHLEGDPATRIRVHMAVYSGVHTEVPVTVSEKNSAGATSVNSSIYEAADLAVEMCAAYIASGSVALVPPSGFAVRSAASGSNNATAIAESVSDLNGSNTWSQPSALQMVVFGLGLHAATEPLGAGLYLYDEEGQRLRPFNAYVDISTVPSG